MVGNSNSGSKPGWGRHGGERVLLTLDVPNSIHKLLTDAARRRDMPIEDLAVGLIGAAVARGNIEDMMNKWNGYLFAGHRVRENDPYTSRRGKPDKENVTQRHERNRDIADCQPARAGEV
jgi:hypothetical protein